MSIVLLLLLLWDPSTDPGVTSYRVAFQAHYRTDVPCPTPEDPSAMCATYWAGAWTEEIISSSSCTTECSTPLTPPYLLTGEVLWFQLVAARDSGCEGETARPPS